MKRLLALLLVSLLLALPVSALGSEKSDTRTAIGMSIAGFSTADLYGNPVNDSILGNAAVTVFNFWATWCGPCVNEMPMFKMLYNYYNSTPEEDVQVIGVVADASDYADARAFVEQQGYQWLQLKLCPELSALLEANTVVGGITIPQTIVVDYNGTVLDQRIGSFPYYNLLYHLAEDNYRYVMQHYPPAPVLYGDADGDGSISANDALLVLRYTLGLIPDTALDLKAADYDRNGSVSANDALAILRKTLGLT